MKLAQDDGAGNGGIGSETNSTDGADGEDACDDGHAGTGHHRLAVHDDIGDHGRGHADDMLASVEPMVRQVDNSARSLGSAETADAMEP